VDGMTNALIFRALERNTGSVGLASVACTSIKAVNPEIAALQQHQDPASDGAAALNKDIATELAKQIAAVGGDPTLANEASTFAPGEKGDSTGAGNTCDDADDAAGCINTQKLRVDDLTDAEITAAVAGVSAGSAAASNNTANAGSNAAAASNNTANAGSNAASNAGSNVQACAAVGSNNTAAAGNAADAAAGNNAGNAADNQNQNGKKNQNQNASAGNNAAASAGNNAAASAGDAASGATAAAGLGDCNAKINFGIPSDGRKEEAFEAADLATFPHGSAQKIDIISQFICSQIQSKCDVGAAEAATCDAAASAASGLKGQAAADAFNSALGQ
jgi:hypothetical protein